MYIVENKTDTRGTVSSTMLNSVKIPLVLLSSKLKLLQENTDNKMVYSNTILFLIISRVTNFTILITLLTF
jgi:hypothetical protein